MDQLRQQHPQQQGANEAVGLAGEALLITVESGSVATVDRVQRFRLELARWNRAPAVVALNEPEQPID